MNKTGMVVFFMLFSVGFFANTVFSADLSIGNDTLINVVSDVSLPELKPLRSYPNAIPISTPTDVFFSFILANSDTRPSKVSVQQTDENGIYIKETGNLVDDGSNGDSLPNDYVYSGTFSISSGAEGKLYYRAAAFFSNVESPLYTDVYELGVTSFPIGFKKTGTSEIVTDRESGVSMLADTILISFVNGTDPATIRSIAERAGGTIVGTLYTLGIYQIEIEPVDNVAALRSKIELLNSFSEVEFAEANVVSDFLDVIQK